MGVCSLPLLGTWGQNSRQGIDLAVGPYGTNSQSVTSSWGLATGFWFNPAFGGNDACLFHSQNSCFRVLRALENWAQQPELLLSSGGAEAVPEPGTCHISQPLHLLLSCKMASFPHPLFTRLTPAHFSRFLRCHLLQVLLNLSFMFPPPNSAPSTPDPLSSALH